MSDDMKFRMVDVVTMRRILRDGLVIEAELGLLSRRRKELDAKLDEHARARDALTSKLGLDGYMALRQAVLEEAHLTDDGDGAAKPAPRNRSLRGTVTGAALAEVRSNVMAMLAEGHK